MTQLIQEERERIKSERLGKIYFWSGLVFIGIAVSIAVIIITNFYSWSGSKIEFDDEASFQDLATTLSGTVGLILTLAGIIFLIYTIQQSKSEMIITNKVMSRSLRETTFFNLLKNHKDIFFGNQNDVLSFSTGVNLMKIQLDSYIEITKDKNEWEFYNYTVTGYQPQYFYENETYNTMSLNMLHLIKYIKNELNDNPFYHDTFFYTLSPSEKFLLGMVINHKLEDPIDTIYPYQEYFEINSKFLLNNLKMPKIELDNKLTGYEYFLPHLEPDKSMLKAVEASTKFNVTNTETLRLSKVWYTAESWNNNKKGKRKNAELKPNKDGSFSFVQIYTDFAARELGDHEVSIDLHFIHHFENKKINSYLRNINLRPRELENAISIYHVSLERNM